jgi:hypothetical protein
MKRRADSNPNDEGEYKSEKTFDRPRVDSVTWSYVHDLATTKKQGTNIPKINEALQEIIECHKALNKVKKMLNVESIDNAIQQLTNECFKIKERVQLVNHVSVLSHENGVLTDLLYKQEEIVKQLTRELTTEHNKTKQMLEALTVKWESENMQIKKQAHDLVSKHWEESKRLRTENIVLGEQVKHCFCKHLTSSDTNSTQYQGFGTPYNIPVSANLTIVNDTVCYPLKKHETAKFINDRFRYCCAELIRNARVAPTNLTTVFTSVFNMLGIGTIGKLPKETFYTEIMYEYAMHGDLYWLYLNQDKVRTSYIDDATSQGKAYQNHVVVTERDDHSLQHHIRGIVHIPDKSAKSKLTAMIVNETNYYRKIVAGIEGFTINNDATDSLYNMGAKVADRCATEGKLTELIRNAQQERGHKYRVLEVKCAVHLCNTCTEDAKKARASILHQQHDIGYELLTLTIKEYRSNVRAKAFVFREIQKTFNFRDQRIARFWKNIVYSSDVFLMLTALHKFVLQELKGIKLFGATNPECEVRLMRLHELLESKDARTCLYIIMIERHKLLAPYLQLVKEKKTAFEFYPADTTANVGDTISFQGIDTSHNVVWNDNND